jgi:hypothetical protein
MQLENIEKHIARILPTLAATGAVMKGSLNKVTLGKKTRTRGERIAYLLTYKGDGNITKSLYVPKEQVHEVKQMIRNYQKVKTALIRLLDLNVHRFKAKQMAEKEKPFGGSRHDDTRLA